MTPDSAGVLVRLDGPVAAFVSPVALRWLCGEDNTATAHNRAACVQAWVGAGLVEADAPQSSDAAPDLAAELVSRASSLDAVSDTPVLVVAVAESCGFCTQLEADLSANASALDRASFGLLVIGPDQVRRYGVIPSESIPALASLGDMASELGTPSGVFQQPGQPPRVVVGYDQVVAAVVEAAGWRQNVVVETPTSCSVTVTQAPDLLAYPLSAGGRVVGVGLGGSVVRDLAEYVRGRSAGAGFVPVVLTVDRPQNLFLVFRGGELLGRLRTAAEVTSLLDTVLAGYAAFAEHRQSAQVPVLCGALYGEGNNEVVLFPRRWMSDLVKQQSRIHRAGWAVCPDPYVISPSPGRRPRCGPRCIRSPGHRLVCGPPGRYRSASSSSTAPPRVAGGRSHLGS